MIRNKSIGSLLKKGKAPLLILALAHSTADDEIVVPVGEVFLLPLCSLWYIDKTSGRVYEI